MIWDTFASGLAVGGSSEGELLEAGVDDEFGPLCALGDSTEGVGERELVRVVAPGREERDREVMVPLTEEEITPREDDGGIVVSGSGKSCVVAQPFSAFLSARGKHSKGIFV